MANTTYQINTRFADDEQGALEDFVQLIRHCRQWGIRPAVLNPLGFSGGYIRVTLRDPIDAAQEAHLNVTKV